MQNASCVYDVCEEIIGAGYFLLHTRVCNMFNVCQLMGQTLTISLFPATHESMYHV